MPLSELEYRELQIEAREKITAGNCLTLTEEEVSVCEELDLILAVRGISIGMDGRLLPTELEIAVLGWLRGAMISMGQVNLDANVRGNNDQINKGIVICSNIIARR